MATDVTPERLESLERASRWQQRLTAALFLLTLAVGMGAYRQGERTDRKLEVIDLVLRGKQGLIAGADRRDFGRVGPGAVSARGLGLTRGPVAGPASPEE